MTRVGSTARRPPPPPSAARIRVRRLLTLVVLGGVVWVALFSPLLALNSDAVDVTMLDHDGKPASTTYVDVAGVNAAVATFVGTPLPRLNLGAIEAAVEGVSGVRSAVAVRSWPRGVTVSVEAQRPVAAVPSAEGGYAIVDLDGVTLATVPEAPPDLPVLTVPLGEGDGEGNARVLAAALAVADSLPDALAIRVEAIRADTEDSVTLFLREGPRVEWGSGDDSRLKAAVVIVLLTSDVGMSAEVIDVSAPTLPVLR